MVRENLENLEKGLFLEKVEENLEKLGNFCKIFQKSGKSQGISFQNTLNVMVFSQSSNLDFQKFSCRTQPWWVLQIIMITTKINTLDHCKVDRGVFEEHHNRKHEKFTIFGQGKKVYFHLKSGRNYPFSALLSGKKGVFLT